MATTVIVGTGIIGLSTAYYLSKRQPGSSIHLVDSSPELFASASGYAGGFLARDWFPPVILPLAELSYEEHVKLAEEHNGREKWAFAKCTTIGHEVNRKKRKGNFKKDEDWLEEGGSRADLVEERKGMGDGKVPSWLRRVDGDSVEVIDDDGGTAVL